MKSLGNWSEFPKKWQYGCHLAKQWAARQQGHSPLRLYHTCPANLSLEEPLVSTNPLCSSWGWQPGGPLLITPRGIVNTASYVNCTPKHTKMWKEYTLNDVQQKWFWLPKELRLPIPSVATPWSANPIFRQLWEVYCAFSSTDQPQQSKAERAKVHLSAQKRKLTISHI